MNASSNSRTHVAARITLVVFLLSGSAMTMPTPTRADSQTGQAGKEKKKDFNDEDLKVETVPGKWMLGSVIDLKQTQDYSVPVIVSGFKTVYGQGKYLRRVKIPQVKIENRSQRVLQSVRLRWAITNYDDLGTVLLEGVIPTMDVRIEPFGEPLLMDIPPIYFNKIVKPLLKDGELNFHAMLIVGIQEARFADGTIWQRGVVGRLPKDLDRQPSTCV